jgi:sugar phosphate isomerase/epimerase
MGLFLTLILFFDMGQIACFTQWVFAYFHFMSTCFIFKLSKDEVFGKKEVFEVGVVHSISEQRPIQLRSDYGTPIIYLYLIIAIIRSEVQLNKARLKQTRLEKNHPERSETLMKILGRTQPLAKYDIFDALKKIGALGFDGVEICLENPDLAPGPLSEALAHQVGKVVGELGLSPHSVSYHKDYIHDERFFAETCKAIGLTREFGTSVFVFSGGPVMAGHPEQDWVTLIERTRELVRLAEQYGVILAEEFEPGFIVGSTRHLHELFAEIPSPHLQSNLDLGHVFLCDAAPLEAIASLKGRIAHGHIENMKAGVHRHLLPDEGDMDLKVYLSALKAVGFEGGLALDLYEQDYEAAAPAAIGYLKQIMP